MPGNDLFMVKPLSVEEVSQFKALPVLNQAQIARVLQIPEKSVLQMTRSRAKHRLPTFRVGRKIGTTYAALERWILERQEEVLPIRREIRRVA